MINNHQLRKDFLFELGTEEMPAQMLKQLQQAFLNNMLQQLEKAQLNFIGDARVFITPRRLAIFIPQLLTLQADQTIERKGPSKKAAFDQQGLPTKACLGFAQSCHISVDELEYRDTAEGTWLFATQKIKGQATITLLAEIIRQAIADLPIGKLMRWGDHPQAFLRPVRWLLALFGTNIVELNLFNLAASNITYGHRFMAPGKIMLQDANEYEAMLYKAYVIADFTQRQQEIKQQLNQAAAILNGYLYENSSLLDQVTGLVEWPCVLAAHFSPQFLAIPDNVLITAMEVHQKSFAIQSQQGSLAPYFLTVSNIASHDPTQVIAGNERVMHARLSDAEFFYTKDLATPLQNHCDALSKVVFQARLGSLQTKSKALAELSKQLAQQLGFVTQYAHEAGLLAKCDLRTQMVGEFPELQGEMGRIYARQQGFSAEIADALLEHYLPRFAQDHLPQTETGISLALADRLLNLVGIFGIGLIPTGEKDPFALRRAAIGICRIIIEKKLQLNLLPVLINTQAIWQKQQITFDTTSVVDLVFDFIRERLRNLYLEQGIRPQVIDAVLLLRLDDLLDIDRRIQAINLFQTFDEAASLAAAQKRVLNLLQKENLLLDDLPDPNPKLFIVPEEQALLDALIELQANILEDQLAKNYTNILQKMALLKLPIDAFFAKVMVMIEDAGLRYNRLCLLAHLARFLNQVADLVVAVETG